MRDWLSKKILEEPSGGMVYREADESTVAAVPRTDGMDLYIGKRVIRSFNLSLEATGKIARFLFWWWICYAWFGFRERLVGWAHDHRQRREHEASLEGLAGRDSRDRSRRSAT